MSDVWQGPGWWLAPDGKWYPADGGPADVVVDDAAPSAPRPAVEAEAAPATVAPEAPADAEPMPDVIDVEPGGEEKDKYRYVVMPMRF